MNLYFSQRKTGKFYEFIFGKILSFFSSVRLACAGKLGKTEFIENTLTLSALLFHETGRI